MRLTFSNETGVKGYAGCRAIAARRIVMHYSMRSTEERLSRLLYEKYGMTLKTACLHVINDCAFMENGDEIAITTKSEAMDRLARLITYGNGVVAGSSILMDALR